MATSSAAQTSDASTLVMSQSELDHFVLNVPSHNTILCHDDMLSQIMIELSRTNKYNEPLYYKLEMEDGNTEEIYNLMNVNGHKRWRELVRRDNCDADLIADKLAMRENDYFTSLKFYARDDKYVIVYEKSNSHIHSGWFTNVYFSKQNVFTETCLLMHNDLTFYQVLDYLSQIYKVSLKVRDTISSGSCMYDSRVMKTSLSGHDSLRLVLSAHDFKKEMSGKHSYKRRINKRVVHNTLLNDVKIHCYYLDKIVGLYHIEYDEETQLYTLHNTHVVF
ncbi:MAG: hypothetical protein QF535_14785 [Anaerolineales bacterium]|nr:hypothetical protein [Anaerolineales bacterium]